MSVVEPTTEQRLPFTRRQFLKGLAGTALAGGALVSAYGGLVEPFNYELSETEIFIADLPESFDGFRILQISDLHHSSLVSLDEIERVVKLCQPVTANLIALTGDYATAKRRYVEPCAEALGRLSAPEGVWAVLGNHDHYIDPQLTIRALTRVHINVLHNANTTLRRGADALQLVGVGDWTWAASDWGRAARGLNPEKASVLLSHQPSVFDLPQTADYSLILGGHTHGGQINLPVIGAPVRFKHEFRYVQGLFERGKTQLYVTRGTGLIGLPFRIGARPQISLLRLRSRAQSEGM